MLKVSSALPFKSRRILCHGNSSVFRPKPPNCFIVTKSVLASATAIQLHNEVGLQQPDQARSKLLAAQFVATGQQLLASCAAVTLAAALFQIVARYISMARDSVAATIPSPPSSPSSSESLQVNYHQNNHARPLSPGHHFRHFLSSHGELSTI